MQMTNSGQTKEIAANGRTIMNDLKRCVHCGRVQIGEQWYLEGAITAVETVKNVDACCPACKGKCAETGGEQGSGQGSGQGDS